MPIPIIPPAQENGRFLPPNSEFAFQMLQHRIATEIAAVREVVDIRFNDTATMYQQRFDAQQKAIADALVAAEKAVTTALLSADRAVVKAETAAEKRFESVNEFRSTLADQAATLIPRAEAEARFSLLGEKLAPLASFVSRVEHETLATALISVQLDMKALVKREDLKPINDAIDKLRETASTTSGRNANSDKVMTFGIAVVAILVSIGGVLYSSAHSSSGIINPGEIAAANAVKLDALLQRGQQSSSVPTVVSPAVIPIQPR